MCLYASWAYDRAFITRVKPPQKDTVAMAENIYTNYKEAFSLNAFIRRYKRHPSQQYTKLIRNYVAAENITRAILEQSRTMFAKTVVASLTLTNLENQVGKLTTFIEQHCTVFPTQLIKSTAKLCWCVVIGRNVQRVRVERVRQVTRLARRGKQSFRIPPIRQKVRCRLSSSSSSKSLPPPSLQLEAHEQAQHVTIVAPPSSCHQALIRSITSPVTVLQEK